MADTRGRHLRLTETILASLGCLALGYCLCTGLQVRAAGLAASRLMTAKGVHATDLPKSNDVIGKIRIPALRLSAPITNGIESIALVRGVGHVPGTAVPGGLGTMGLAGHRDTFFRSLRNVKAGMEILVSDEGGTYRYVVDSTEIVGPDQVRVLDIESQPQLVLITCYPFDFIGAAPRRFIVHARLLSVLSEPNEARKVE